MVSDTSASPATFGRTNPFPAHIKLNRRLNPGSEKDTRHIELDLTGSGLNYEVGESLAVHPTNDPNLIEEILHTLCATGDELVPAASKGKEPLPFRDALLREYKITQPTPKFLKAIAERASAAPLLKELLHPERKQDLDAYVWGMDMIDFLLQHSSIKFTPEEFVGLLSKLQPRLYSIASSLKAFPDQVHLTVDVVRYESHGRQRAGVCSSFLAERAEGHPIPVFISPSKFRLPEDGNTPIIMVGPGTGIAPFRAFLQERKAIGAKGKAWLFFGSQKESCDYFYKDEFDQLQKDGVLTKMHCAFSRDQAHKIYVQTRMLENAAELWKWIDEGAEFFVCGDAKRMAKDVDAALQKIVQEQGGMDAEQANNYVEKMKAEKRYKRDVY